MNCPAYINDSLKSTFGFLPSIIIVVAFLFTILVTVGSIVVEKQTKMKVKFVISIVRNFFWK